MSIVHNVHNHKNASEIDQILSQYVPAHVVSYLVEADMKIVPMPSGVSYADASRVIRRMGVDVDAWRIPPAGLFVVEERTVYLRTVSSMTIVHELGHALDCALGGGVYRSGFDPKIRQAFENATAFVTPYAACGLDEFFAESWRAYLGANDPFCTWPTVTRAKLQACSPTMLALFEEIIDELKLAAAKYAA